MRLRAKRPRSREIASCFTYFVQRIDNSECPNRIWSTPCRIGCLVASSPLGPRLISVTESIVLPPNRTGSSTMQSRILALSERLSQFAQRGARSGRKTAAWQGPERLAAESSSGRSGYSHQPVGFVAGSAGSDMMGRLQSRARNRVKRIIDFRTRVANKSDWAINAVLNHFWSKLNPSTPPIQKNKDRLRH
ncbi:hypothetical protein ABIF64_001772 [Bradyrhizobium japonicum]